MKIEPELTKAVKTEPLDQEIWERLRRAVHAAAESGPVHKVSPKPVNKKERPASKGRVHKGKTRS